MVGVTQLASLRLMLLSVLLCCLIPSLIVTKANAQNAELWQSHLKANRQFRKLVRQGRPREAIPFAERALEFAERAKGPDSAIVTLYLKKIATFHESHGDLAAAAKLYERGVKIWEQRIGDNESIAGDYRNKLVSLYVRQGRFAEAELLFKRTRDILEKKARDPGPPLHPGGHPTEVAHPECRPRHPHWRRSGPSEFP